MCYVARNFRESFAKVAVLLCKRKKGKLCICVTKVLLSPTADTSPQSGGTRLSDIYRTVLRAREAPGEEVRAESWWVPECEREPGSMTLMFTFIPTFHRLLKVNGLFVNSIPCPQDRRA